jgi:hypothetical protein
VQVSQGEFQRGLTAAVGVALVALLAVPASAAAGTKSKSATAAGNFAIASATAKCPSGQRATGGGFTASLPSATAMLVYESRKVSQRSWRASGQILDPGASGAARTVTAFVYCSEGVQSTQAKSANVTKIGVGTQFVAADAKCSSGKVQAGGFLGPPPNTDGFGFNYTVADSLRADKKTWRSRWRSFVSGVTFTSYVYCADRKKPAARSGSTTSTTDNTFHTALSAECKRGTKPVAGGFSQPNAFLGLPDDGLFTDFYESFKSGKRWRTSARHSGTVSTTLNSIAYCG